MVEDSAIPFFICQALIFTQAGLARSGQGHEPLRVSPLLFSQRGYIISELAREVKLNLWLTGTKDLLYCDHTETKEDSMNRKDIKVFETINGETSQFQLKSAHGESVFAFERKGDGWTNVLFKMDFANMRSVGEWAGTR